MAYRFFVWQKNGEPEVVEARNMDVAIQTYFKKKFNMAELADGYVTFLFASRDNDTQARTFECTFERNPRVLTEACPIAKAMGIAEFSQEEDDEDAVDRNGRKARGRIEDDDDDDEMIPDDDDGEEVTDDDI